ncbi:MAG: CPBP family intramembrane metalloprotease [Rhodospirillaceae bacterium]|nr:CPBP family intramembrane metalloprotease [Rhodospirillaceae bacterium]
MAVTLPLIALAAQFAIGLVASFAGLRHYFDAFATPLLALVVVAGASGLVYLALARLAAHRAGANWRNVGLVPPPPKALSLAVALGAGTALLASLFEAALRGAEPSFFGILSGAELLVVFLVLAGLVPFAEEVLFRGIVFPILDGRIGGAGAIVSSALIFGIFHLNPPQILVGFLLGLPLAWLRRRWGSLWVPVALHTTHNAGVVALGAWFAG